MRRGALRIILVLLTGLVVPACTERTKIIDNSASTGSGGGGGYDWYVDAQTGDDTNGGTQGDPFKTITQALTMAVLGDYIKVQPGTYDAANGEVFPLRIPGGIRMIGDEANKGDGIVPTLVTGDGPGPGSTFVTLQVDPGLAPGAETVIAGLKVTNTGGSGTRAGVLVGGSLGTGANLCVIRNSTLVGSPDIAIFFINAANGCIVRDNIIRFNGTGIRFEDSGFDARVERNIIRDNTVGIYFSTPTSLGGSWDIGGGPAGSLGANELSSNSQNDILMTGTGGHNVDAQNNFWDHVPPSGNDWFIVSGTFNLTTTGAALAPNPTP